MVDYKEVIFISDIHFGLCNGSLEWLNNMKSYFDEFFIPLITNEKNKRRKPCVVVAGDYFDNRTCLDINVLNVACDVMEGISSVCDVYMMVGNHDITKENDTDITSLRVFDKFKNVKLIHDTYELNVNGKSFMLVSWIGDMSVENKLMAKNACSHAFMVFHTELSGMSYDNGRLIVNGVNVSIIGDDCYVISGHIHKRQEGKKSLYLGSPYHMKRSDIGNEKGIYIFRCKDDSTVEREFIKNDFSPVFNKVEFSSVGRNTEKWEPLVKNNYIDIVFSDDDVKNININKFIEELQSYNPKRIELIKKVPEIINPETGEPFTRDEIKESMSVYPDVETMFNKRIGVMGLSNQDMCLLSKMNDEYLKRATCEE